LAFSGAFNRNGNDGTISRFGWKAQNKSLHIFSGEAYNVEMGSPTWCSHKTVRCWEDSFCVASAGCLNLSGNGYQRTRTIRRSDGGGGLDDASDFPTSCGPWPAATGGVVLNGTSVSAQSIANGAPCLARSAARPATIPCRHHAEVKNHWLFE